MSKNRSWVGWCVWHPKKRKYLVTPRKYLAKTWIELDAELHGIKTAMSKVIVKELNP